MGIRARATGVLVAFLAAVGLSLAAPPVASAVPGLPDCKEPPIVYAPSDVPLAQWLDPQRAAAPDAAPFADTPPRLYSSYGYAGFKWSTYDLGCAGALSSFDSLQATADTATGNQLLGLAVSEAAVTNGVHARLGDLSSFMAPLDDVVADTTAALRDAIYRPWIGGALAVVVAVMLGLASAGQLSQTLRAGAWALAVLTVTMGVLNFPIRAAQFFDQAVGNSVEAVNAAAAGFGTAQAASDGRPAAQSALLVDRVLYDSWVRGMFGTTSGAAVQRYARPLWEAHTLTYDEERTYRAGGSAAKTLVEEKNDRWTQTMERIASDDPSLYQQLQGKKGGRVGVGVMTVASTSAIGLFRMVADLYVLLGMVVIRLLVMFAPLIGVLGVVVTFGGVVRWAGNMLGAAVINTVGFSLGAVVHTVATNALINGSDGGLEFGRLLLAGLLTLGLFVLCWPLLSLRRIAGRDHRPGAGLLAKGGRMARSYATTRSATAAGVREAVDDAGSPDDDSRRRSRQVPTTAEYLRPEGQARPHPVVIGGYVEGAAGPASRRVPASLPGTSPHAIVASSSSEAPASPRSGSPSGTVRAADVQTREIARRREVGGGLYVPGGPIRAGERGAVVEGRVVGPEEDPFPRRTVHESNRRNGDRPGVVYVYDPTTRQDVPVPDAASSGAPRRSRRDYEGVQR